MAGKPVRIRVQFPLLWLQNTGSNAIFGRPGREEGESSWYCISQETWINGLHKKLSGEKLWYFLTHIIQPWIYPVKGRIHSYKTIPNLYNYWCFCPVCANGQWLRFFKWEWSGAFCICDKPAGKNMVCDRWIGIFPGTSRDSSWGLIKSCQDWFFNFLSPDPGS